MSLFAQLRRLEQKASSITNAVKVIYAGVNAKFTQAQIADKSTIYVYLEI